MKGRKKKIAIGIVLLLLSAGILTATPINKNIIIEEKTEERIIIRFETYILKDEESNKNTLNSRFNEPQYDTIEKNISIPHDISEELITTLTDLKAKILTSESQEEKISLYSDCLKLLREHNILPDSFTIESLLKTTEEITQIIYQNKEILPKIFHKVLYNNANRVNIEEKKCYTTTPFGIDVNPGESRLDIGSVFFILSFLSMMTPWPIVPNPIGDGDVIEISITDLAIGQALIDMFPNCENITFLLGWIGGFGYAMLYSIAGNSLIGGQALYSWPSGIPMYPYLYSGASLILPVGLITGSLTLLMDRGPKQVPIPLLELAIVGSIITVHMPYAKY